MSIVGDGEHRGVAANRHVAQFSAKTLGAQFARGMQMLGTRGAPGDPQFPAPARGPKERTGLIERRNERGAGLSEDWQGVERALQHGGRSAGLHPSINRRGIDLAKIGGVDQIVACIERA